MGLFHRKYEKLLFGKGMLMLYSILYSGGHIDFLTILMQLLASIVVILLILPLHELAHGFVAYKLGDDTAKLSGRLTLNPLAHLNYMGAACILLIGFGWAEPVPVNMRRLKHPKRDMALVALAGPVSNLLAALVGAIILQAILIFTNSGTAAVYIASFLMYYISVNVGLAVFNLIPIPPLDGSKILAATLSDSNYIKFMVREKQYSIFLMLLIATDIIGKIINPISSLIESGILFLATLPFLPFM